MKHWKWIVVTLAVGVVVGVVSTPAVAEDVAVEKADTPKAQSMIVKAKTPFDWLKMSADLRIRHIYERRPGFMQGTRNYSGHFSDERNWERVRTRIRASLTPFGKKYEFNVGVANEWRNYIKPVGGVSNRYNRDLDLDEFLIDRLNIKVSDLIEMDGMPWSLTVGRQDISLGSNFLFGDGTPLDGTRTMFSDAVRCTVKMEECKSTVDVIYINQVADDGDRLQPLNDQDAVICAQDEQGLIVYVTHRLNDSTNVDVYFAYKRDDVARGGLGQNADIYTLGLRAAGTWGENVMYEGEFMPQSGKKAGVNINTCGAQAKVTYAFKDKFDNAVFLWYGYRGGGKRPTGDFDMLWGRRPHYIDAFAEPSNTHRATVGWAVRPLKDVSGVLCYSALFRDRQNVSGGGISNAGVFRGNLVSAQVRHKINKHLTHRVNVDVFDPGNVQTRAANETYLRARYEMMISW